jgi:hypothetical protein
MTPAHDVSINEGEGSIAFFPDQAMRTGVEMGQAGERGAKI